MNNIIHKELSDHLIGLAYTVHNILGPGLLENAYEEAMCVELKLNNIPFERQKVYPLEYKGHDIGGYIADLVVDNKVILELKSVTALNPAMETQRVPFPKVEPWEKELGQNRFAILWSMETDENSQ